MERYKKNILVLGFIFCLFGFVLPSQTSAKSLIDALIYDKECNYVQDGKYMPHSDIDAQFPGFKDLMNGKCVNVTNKVTDMFITGFKVFLGLVSIFAVINISIAGIQYMLQDKSMGKMRAAKKRLTDSIIGLVLALSGFVILYSVNVKLTEFGLDLRGGELGQMIQQGAADIKNIAPVEGGCVTGSVGCGTTDGDGTGTGVGAAAGTGNATGARQAGTPTIFGYKDGNGTVGEKGDNGLGNGSWSPVSGWTYYNGGAHNPSGDASNYSQGVALPRATLIRDFGSAANVKNGAYEIFVGGKSIGAFPVVDDSARNLDLTYGLVKNHIDPTVTNSNSWSGAGKNITYKPLPNYWSASNPRPPQPMVRDDFTDSSPTAAVVDNAVTDPSKFKFQ